jgi:hypothetical protein
MRIRVITVATFAAALGLALVVLPALPASAKGLSSSQINNLEKTLNQHNKVTFEATYTAVSSSNPKQTITIAQAPPKSYFGTGPTSSVVNTGKATYFCSQNSGNSGSTGSTGGTGNSGNSGNTVSTTTTTKAATVQCLKESGTSPLLGIEDLFSPTAAIAALNEAKVGAIARAEGVHISSSSGKYAGQSATCFTVSKRGTGAGKYCVTSQGILAYASTANNAANNYFELTKYTAHPSSSLFTLPAGATTVTTPSIPDVSIPSDVSIP